jgi:transcriptional regulator of acetoin/glycerol metabolism
MFTARPMTFVCLNDEMRQHRPTVFEILGAGAVRNPDWVTVESATGSGPMLLTGKAGCDLDRLAHAIHAMSSRRNRKPVEIATVPPEGEAQVALVEQAFQTSLILPLGQDDAPLDPDFVSKLFDARCGVRLIALAASPDIARRALTEANVELMQHIPVRALAYRRGEIHQLLERQFTERAFHRRVEDLTPVNQDALKRYHWPSNLVELRETADAVIALATLGGMRRAAASLGVSRQKLTRRLERVGLTLPLFCQDE